MTIMRANGFLHAEKRRAVSALGFVILLQMCSINDGIASKLSPNATKIERMNANKYDGGRFVRVLAGYGLTLFTEPVHEEIAQRAYLWGVNGVRPHLFFIDSSK